MNCRRSIYLMSGPPARLLSVHRLSAASLTGPRAGPPHRLIMTGQAVDGRPLFLMAINAKAHRMIDGALGDGHLHDIPMAVRALDFRPDMRRMIEPDVRFPDESVNPLPGNVFSALCKVAQGLDSGIDDVADVLMTTHADIDARNSRPRPLTHPRVTGVAKDADIVGM